MSISIEENLIHYIASSLPLFSKQSNSYRFQCPYCQFSGKDSKGKSLVSSTAKGYFYSIYNAWNYKCHKCGISQSFEKFIAAQYPLLQFEYDSPPRSAHPWLFGAVLVLFDKLKLSYKGMRKTATGKSLISDKIQCEEDIYSRRFIA